MDLKQTRIERLTSFAKRNGVMHDPAGLGLLIGKKPNQVYNLLSGQGSFGEKVARSIEEAAGLPRGWLDAEAPVMPSELLPEVAQLAQAINDLPELQRKYVIKTVTTTLSYLPDLFRPTTDATEARQEPSPERSRKLREG